MVPLLAVNHELKLWELLGHGQHLLFVSLLVAIKGWATVCRLFLLVERILPETGSRVPHPGNRVVHVYFTRWANSTALVVRGDIGRAAAWVRGVVRIAARVLREILGQIGARDGASKARGACRKLSHFILS